MYLVIKREKSDHLKHKIHQMKELACEVMECLEEAYAEGQESETRERSRRMDRYNERKRYEDDYDDDYGRESARGRNRIRY